MKYLFITSIGPVQDFIASARRSRDLWYGSWLLSELSKAAAREIIEQEKSLDALIFPAPENEDALSPGTDLNVANKILALIQMPPQEMGVAVERAIRRRLQELWGQAQKQIKGDYDRENAQKQIDDMLEIFWAGLPLDEANYSASRKQLEALLASRKATKNFQRVDWGSDTLKSSLDGQRECVIPASNYVQAGDSDEMRAFKNQCLFQWYGAKPAERLSGVDLLKRLGRSPNNDGFPSTSHMASIPFLRGLIQDEKIDEQNRKVIAERMQEYNQTLQKLGIQEDSISTKHAIEPFSQIDGSILYKARYTQHIKKGEETYEQAESAFQSFQKAISLMTKRPSINPSPYYALVLADGDRMGLVIDRQKDPAAHRRLSQQLSAFAGTVDKIVTEHHGGLVYAGGDDVLAFLPLHKALACTKKLAASFAESMQGFTDKEGNPPTLSAGIAVSHFIDPLEDMFELARSAERRAKGVDGKSALAITVSKRSGADRTVAGKWGDLDKRLEIFAQYIRQDEIPAGFAYELIETNSRMPLDDGEGALLDLGKMEVVRILKRKRGNQGTAKMGDKIIDYFNDSVVKEVKTARQLADELIVAKMLADSMDEANEPKENAQ